MLFETHNRNLGQWVRLYYSVRIQVLLVCHWLSVNLSDARFRMTSNFNDGERDFCVTHPLEIIIFTQKYIEMVKNTSAFAQSDHVPVPDLLPPHLILG